MFMHCVSMLHLTSGLGKDALGMRDNIVDRLFQYMGCTESYCVCCLAVLCCSVVFFSIDPYILTLISECKWSWRCSWLKYISIFLQKSTSRLGQWDDCIRKGQVRWFIFYVSFIIVLVVLSYRQLLKVKHSRIFCRWQMVQWWILMWLPQVLLLHWLLCLWRLYFPLGLLQISSSFDFPIWHWLLFFFF